MDVNGYDILPVGLRLMTNLRQVLASNIRQCRKKLGLSQGGLAERADTATNYIGLIETGKKFPSIDMIEKIAEALQIDTLELFSIKPVPVDDALKNLKKEILAEVEKLIAERFKKFSDSQPNTNITAR
jgi:transcriptional regulator with XRE-family HTH domain